MRLANAMSGPSSKHSTSSSISLINPTSPVHDMHQRPQFVARPTSSLSSQQGPSLSESSRSSSRVNLNAISRSSANWLSNSNIAKFSVKIDNGESNLGFESEPSLCGLPLKYVALVTLAVQNAALSVVMHYSRVSTSPTQKYSPATAVLFNEIIKGSISFLVALMRTTGHPAVPPTSRRTIDIPQIAWHTRLRRLNSEIFSPDCWKLSIPAILYVIQNTLQFVAVSNLPVATYQVSYQMKILTTAAFSVFLLGKTLNPLKWIALLFLAVGVGVVQLQATIATHTPMRDAPVGSAAAAAPMHTHIMRPLIGFSAVLAACFTSGLAGVYFEMVLKNSKADLWVRNVQLSLFSLIPALLPLIYSSPADPRAFISDAFKNFGGWAWATVSIQVIGGLVTAIVIKYSDNIMKGFATSLSIILSFLASVALFNYRITTTFVIGSTTVLVATYLYNYSPPQAAGISTTSEKNLSMATPFVASFGGQTGPIIGQFPPEKSGTSPFGSPKLVESILGLSGSSKSDGNSRFGGESMSYLSTPSPYGSRFPSRTPSPILRSDSNSYLNSSVISPWSSRSASPMPSPTS